MTNKEIKENLLKSFCDTFDIEKHFDENGEIIQSYEHFTTIKWMDAGENTATISVCGSIFLGEGKDCFHNPLPYGSSENQGDPNYISDWDIGEVLTYINGKDVSSLITFDDLFNYLDQKELCEQ